MANHMNDPVSQADLALVREEMRTMEERIYRRIDNLKSELIVWIVGLMLVNDGVLLTAIKLLN